MASVKSCVVLALVLAGWQLGCVLVQEEEEQGEEGGGDEAKVVEDGGATKPGAAREPCTAIEADHQVLLMLQPPQSKTPTKIRCGGSMIDQLWVLTAAHCDHKNLVAVISKDHTFSKHDVIKIDKRKTYVREGVNGIMLLKLDRSWLGTKFSKYPVISLPSKSGCSKPPTGRNVKFVGWKEAKLSEEELTPISAGNIPSAQCRTLKVTDGTDSKLVYAGGAGDDPCSGDSGGAMIFDDLLYGVVEVRTKTSCSAPIKFSSICAYWDWIHKKTGK